MEPTFTEFTKEPTLVELNNIRKEGFRPGTVACILHNKKLLMFYKIDHKIWQLPQGGIKNTENPKDAIKRQLTEELGATFVKLLDIPGATYLTNDRMEFKPGKHESEKMESDEGVEIPMIGKEYFFFAIQSKKEELVISETQFDQHFWVSFREGYFLAEKMYQRGKKRITIKILNKLNDMGLIS